MKTLTLTSSVSLTENWWPALHLKKGRKLAPITPEQCGPLMAEVRGDKGASEVSPIPLYDETGARVGRISYNGRVWAEDFGGDIEISVKVSKPEDRIYTRYNALLDRHEAFSYPSKVTLATGSTSEEALANLARK